ncbi:hypothetical protein NDI85_17775 [Halomicroarcula sp. S1AR25-4]|uniref:hypothetical protein n=1 Tax=Haloarcula sp. S1AR25-4 TaxID=2950538 RepID=UPI0028761111|nr:hypothetical protein [Halomicroarcula sp. S1AR25-4]MDS0279647.1 hypothetical protein [Halomicroarcula sp. S1AR25-4]
MTEELIDLHQEILDEFESRLDANDEVPDDVLEKMREFESLALRENEDLKQAIQNGLEDETA